MGNEMVGQTQEPLSRSQKHLDSFLPLFKSTGIKGNECVFNEYFAHTHTQLFHDKSFSI